MQRLLTAAVTVPLALLLAFGTSDFWFFMAVVAIVGWGAVELVTLVQRSAPDAPLAMLPALVILLAAAAWVHETRGGTPTEIGDFALIGSLAALSLGISTLILFARTPLEQVLPALGGFGFGLPYLVLPIVCLTRLKMLDPWVLLLLFAIVWLGDTAAYYVGSRWGRRTLAPTVSPNKTWEGALAGFVTGLLATAIWSQWRHGELDPTLIGLGGITALAAQVGDLVESMLKRGAGVKDSGALLPGHGGVLDRLDALLFAAPTLQVGLMWLGTELVGR